MYKELKAFVEKVCAYKNHYCNGEHIKTKDIEDREPCRFFVDGRCKHLLNPKNMPKGIEERERNG